MQAASSLTRMTPTWIRGDRLQAVHERSADRSGAVLLIEDDVAIAEMFALGLYVRGHPVRTAKSDDSASMLTADADRPSVIVLDLDRPSERGLEILNSLLVDPSTSGVPVIVLYDEDADFPEAYRRGATEFRAKYRTTPMELVRYVEERFVEPADRKSP